MGTAASADAAESVSGGAKPGRVQQGQLDLGQASAGGMKWGSTSSALA